MGAGHLHQWHISVTRDDRPDTTNCLEVVDIVQAALHDGTLANECMWKKVILIPKEASGDFRGVGLVEVLWKTVISFLNHQLTTSIIIHDVMHRLRSGQWTGTAELGARLLQQI